MLRREVKQRREMKRTDSTRRGAPFVFSLHYSKTFQLPCDRSYTRSAWQKFRHRLVPATRVVTRRGEATRGEAGGGGGACVDVPLVLMLIHVGKEPPL